jgi:hypothetical protein
MGHRRLRGSALAFALAGVLSLVTVLPGSAASSTVTVTPGSLAVNATSWYFYNDVNNQASTAEDPAHYKFVGGPASPPAGIGSVFFHNDAEPLVPTNQQQRWTIATRRYAGTSLATLSALKFNTYEPSGEEPDAIFLNFDIKFGAFGSTPAATTYQGRLSYVPRQNGTVLGNTWQEWSTTNGGALWSWSRFAGNGNKWPDGNTAQLRTWADIAASFPNATMDNPASPGFGQLVFRSGEPYPTGFTGFLDKVTVGVGSNETVFDFEPYDVAADKDECKNGGWQNLRRADGTPFKNQGDCVSYTNNGR